MLFLGFYVLPSLTSALVPPHPKSAFKQDGKSRPLAHPYQFSGVIGVRIKEGSLNLGHNAAATAFGGAMVRHA